MKYLPWILSGALTTVILYMIWQNRSKRKPEIASDKTSQELLTIDVNSIESVLKDFFNMYGLSFNYQIEDAKSLSGALFDSFIDLKKVIENQNYIGTLANLKPILYDLESLAKASWASKETSSFINNMIQLIEHTLGITRLSNITIDMLQTPSLWENFDSNQVGKVEVRRSPWIYNEDIIIQGELERKTNET